jgi:hypothetical protein
MGSKGETAMAIKANIRLVVLWEKELRLAAKALRALSEAPPETPEAEFGRRVKVAIEASAAALWGADDEGASLIISTPGELLKRATKEPR